MSMLFREKGDSAVRPWRFTCLASVALVEASDEAMPGLHLGIKWPNDVMLNDAKLAGVLAETRWDGRELQAIVGVGVNVSAPPTGIDGAISLSCGTRTPVDRGHLLLSMLKSVDRLRARPFDELHDLWQSRLWRRGQRLRLVDLGREEE